VQQSNYSAFSTTQANRWASYAYCYRSPALGEVKQVCVQSLSSALNTTFAAERRRLQHGSRSASAAIDRYFLSVGCSTVNPPAVDAAADRWVKQTDGRTPDRYRPIDRVPHTMRAASKMLWYTAEKFACKNRQCLFTNRRRKPLSFWYLMDDCLTDGLLCYWCDEALKYFGL